MSCSILRLSVLAAIFVLGSSASRAGSEQSTIIGQPTVFWHDNQWQTYQNGIWVPYSPFVNGPTDIAAPVAVSDSQPDNTAGGIRPLFGTGQRRLRNHGAWQGWTGSQQTQGTRPLSNVAIGQSMIGIGQSTIGIGQSTIGIGQSTIGIGQSTVGLGRPYLGIGRPGGLGKRSDAHKAEKSVQ
ncbi:MAG TPA: hypothetical protein VG146_13745 [Verrucomicrobiae bacterium]|nr:hypothetical protein [Verrucomicrobiae bacterium]